jgi:hypothetical protein
MILSDMPQGEIVTGRSATMILKISNARKNREPACRAEENQNRCRNFPCLFGPDGYCPARIPTERVFRQGIIRDPDRPFFFLGEF